MLTNKDYCDYDTCVALKELGYKVPTSAYYMPHHKDLIWVSNPFRGGYVIDCFYSHNSLSKGVMTANFIDAPTLWEAQKWLREEKEFYVFVGREWENTYYYWISKKFGDKTEGITHSFYYPNGEGRFSSYEEALSEGIKEAVKLLKDE